MQHDTGLIPKSEETNWLLWMRWLWIILCLVLLARAFLMPTRQTVHHNYTSAGRHWWNGTDAYELHYLPNGQLKRNMSGYRYSPLVSAFFVPFALLPDRLGNLLWRILSYSSYIFVLLCFFREVLPRANLLSARQKAWWWLLLMPLSLPSMNNGQANVLVLACMLAAAVAVMRERWNLAALVLAAAFFLKLYPVAVCLLFVVAYPRRLGWRLLVALLIGLAAPFALQHPSYVWNQYASWYTLLVTDQRGDYPLVNGYRDFYLLTRYLGQPMPEAMYLALQLTTAAFLAGIVWWGRWRDWPKQHLTNSILLLGCCWILVFGPATESCTFLLLAPGLAWALVDAFAFGRSYWTLTILCIVFGSLMSYSIANWFPTGRQFLFILQPIAALLFLLERCCFVCAHSAAPCKNPVTQAEEAACQIAQWRLVLAGKRPRVTQKQLQIVCLLMALGLFLNQPLLAGSGPSGTQGEQPVRGVVIVIGGVGGMDLLGASANLTFPYAGVKHEIREFVWTHGRGKLFTDLQDRAHLRAKAEELADYIRRLKAEDPNRPIFIVAKSGGTGLALLAAELLPANAIERMVLLSAAVSPGFDLRRALRATHGEIVSFHSANDQFVLNFGTRQFGTIDGVQGPSAGLHGFRPPEMQTLNDEDRELYRRLVQVPWSPSMLLEFHNGSHASTSFPMFLALEVAPWLR